MQLKLSDKIKQYRKKMGLTQEGLAEAIGVTVGAVSKWENGNTVPDIMTIMQLANYFSISIDELLGFDLTSKNIDDMCNSIEEHCHRHDYEQAVIESNDAMSRYPHNFKVIYTSASLYYYRYLSRLDKNDAKRAIELFKSATNYLSQNINPDISDYSIKSKIAFLYSEVDPEKSIELLKQINYEGINNNAIGQILANTGKADEAMIYFTTALFKSFSEQLNVIYNIADFIILTDKRADVQKAIEMVDVEINLIKACSVNDSVNYTDKMRAGLLILKACLHSKVDEQDAMKKCVKEAYVLADSFDKQESVPDLTSSIKFMFSRQKVIMHDTTGTEAKAGIDNILEIKLKTKDGKTNNCVKSVIEYWQKLKENVGGDYL